MSILAPHKFETDRPASGFGALLKGAARAPAEPRPSDPPAPQYLKDVYWWAYVHPNAVRVFERPWLVNLILWGNYERLCRAAADELGDMSGRTLQIACAYGDLTPMLARESASAGGVLDVVDVLPIQLDNLRSKLPPGAPVRTMAMDSSALRIADATYDRALLFFLLHEMPEDVRRRTIAEALRVVKPGGKLVIVDYARPRWWSPWRYLFRPVLALLEPFALDLWRSDVDAFMPEPWRSAPKRRASFFGGLYQRVSLTR